MDKIEKRAALVMAAESGDGASDQTAISGYAARFNSMSEDLGGFFEIIEPGAFASAVKKSDVRALLNHDPSKLLGRTGVNLNIEERADGLYMEITPVDLPIYWEVLGYIKAGLITQQSFGFTVGEDRWERKDGKDLRIIKSIDRLYDVSPVTYPAYPETSVAVRSLKEFRAKNIREGTGEFSEEKWGEFLKEIRGKK